MISSFFSRVFIPVFLAVIAPCTATSLTPFRQVGGYRVFDDRFYDVVDTTLRPEVIAEGAFHNLLPDYISNSIFLPSSSSSSVLLPLFLSLLLFLVLLFLLPLLLLPTQMTGFRVVFCVLTLRACPFSIASMLGHRVLFLSSSSSAAAACACSAASSLENIGHVSLVL